MQQGRLSRAEREDLQRYVNEEKDRLGLHNWEIEVMHDLLQEPADYTEFAGIDAQDYADIATLRVGAIFRGEPEHKQRRILAHELAHLHSYRVTEFVKVLKRYVPPDAWAMFEAELEKKEDIMIENLSKLFAGMMSPLHMPREGGKK